MWNFKRRVVRNTDQLGLYNALMNVGKAYNYYVQ